MIRRIRDVFPKNKLNYLGFFALVLVLTVIYILPTTLFANDEAGGLAPGSIETETAVDPAATDPTATDPAATTDPTTTGEPADSAAAAETPPPEPAIPEAAPLVVPSPLIAPIIPPTSAQITIYKTTTGGGDFGTETFNFNVIRVANRYGNPLTVPDETFIENYGMVTVTAGPNEKVVPASFTIHNLTAPDGQALYFFKISEINTPGGDWIFDSREIVVQILVVAVEDNLVVPRQGQEWFHNGVSYDAKGGANPFPPNDFNTFVNEYTGGGEALGRLRIRKDNFTRQPTNPNERFGFRVSRDGNPVDLTALGITLRRSGNGIFTATDLTNGGFSLTYDAEVEISGLPVGAYYIEEFAVGFEISHKTNGVPGAGSGVNVMVNQDAETTVVFTNTEMAADTRLTVRKLLAGDYESWGANNDTGFWARVVDARGRYLTFDGTAPNYSFTGISATGSEIRFSVTQPAVITGIPIGTIVTVEEIIPADARFTVTYSDTAIEISGGVNRDAEVTLTNTYENHGVGNITVSKQLAGSYAEWGVDNDTVFTIVVNDITDPNNVYPLHFRRLSIGNYEAVAIGTGNPYIELTAGRPVVLSMLWDDRIYQIAETGGVHYTTTFVGNGAMLPPSGHMNVTLTNTFEPGVGNLIIGKKLAGSPGDWGVDENTVFLARVRDVTDGNYVLFALQPDGRYLAVGNNNSPLPTNDTRELVRFTANSPAILTGLWPNHVYMVEELGGPHRTVSYSGNNAMLPEGGNMSVIITNTYERGEGNLVLNKVLEGFPGDWGVDENTVFYARVKDVTDNNYLLFVQQDDGTYRAFGNTGSPVPTNDPRERVRITAGRPVVLTGLWVNQEYVVEEVPGPNFTTSFQGLGAMPPRIMPAGGNMNVTITNIFDHDVGNITIRKFLVGNPGDWNVDENTEFTARLKDVTDVENIYEIYFERQADGRYLAVGSGMDPSPAGDPVIRFTAARPVILTALWENRIYQIVEDEGEHFTTVYTGNNLPIPESGNLNITVTNVFGDDIGRMRITKAAYIGTPANPREAFHFIIRRNGQAVDLTAAGINVRKTGGLGEFNPVNLPQGRFTLTFDTEITVFGLPEGSYTVTEDVLGFETSHVVRTPAGTAPSVMGPEAVITVIGGAETAVTFTNAESDPPGITPITVGDTGRLRIRKAHYITTPAHPHEAFTFIVIKDSSPVDLTAGDIKITKTDGTGSFVPVDLPRGRFTLTFDTEVTIEHLPVGIYSVTEDVTGFHISYEIIDNMETYWTGVSDFTVIFTNEEFIEEPTVPFYPGDPGVNYPEDPEPRQPGRNIPGEPVTVDVHIVRPQPTVADPQDAHMLREVETTATQQQAAAETQVAYITAQQPAVYAQEAPAARQRVANPQTGDGTTNGNGLPLLAMVISGAVLFIKGVKRYAQK